MASTTIADVITAAKTNKINPPPAAKILPTAFSFSCTDKAVIEDTPTGPYFLAASHNAALIYVRGTLAVR